MVAKLSRPPRYGMNYLNPNQKKSNTIFLIFSLGVMVQVLRLVREFPLHSRSPVVPNDLLYMELTRSSVVPVLYLGVLLSGLG